MNRRLSVCATLISFLLGGCATHQVLEPVTVSERIGRTPDLNVIASVPIGGTVYAQFRYWSRRGIRLSQPVTVGLGLGRVSVSAGEFVQRSTADGKPAFCTERLAYVDPLTGPLKPACFLDTSNSGSFTHVTAAPSVIWFEKALPAPVRYETAELVIPRHDAFRYELLLQGVSGKTLRLSFREFLNDMARPAFFQEAAYDIDQLPLTVTFRTVRLEILEAGNAGLRYKVLSGF